MSVQRISTKKRYQEVVRVNGEVIRELGDMATKVTAKYRWQIIGERTDYEPRTVGRILCETSKCEDFKNQSGKSDQGEQEAKR